MEPHSICVCLPVLSLAWLGPSKAQRSNAGLHSCLGVDSRVARWHQTPHSRASRRQTRSGCPPP